MESKMFIVHLTSEKCKHLQKKKKHDLFTNKVKDNIENCIKKIVCVLNLKCVMCYLKNCT